MISHTMLFVFTIITVAPCFASETAYEMHQGDSPRRIATIKRDVQSMLRKEAVSSRCSEIGEDDHADTVRGLAELLDEVSTHPQTLSAPFSSHRSAPANSALTH